MEDKPIIITYHAYDRAKERLGWKASALDRMMPIVMAKGKKHGETKGNLHKWISEKFRTHCATDMRVFGHHCFFIKGDYLVTILYLPPDLKKCL